MLTSLDNVMSHDSFFYITFDLKTVAKINMCSLQIKLIILISYMKFLQCDYSILYDCPETLGFCKNVFLQYKFVRKKHKEKKEEKNMQNKCLKYFVRVLKYHMKLYTVNLK